MAIDVAKKHLFVEMDDECCRNEYYIAETLEQARGIQHNLIGENPRKIEDWLQCAGDDDFMLWLDDTGMVAERDCGELVYDKWVIGKCDVWAEAYDVGFLCAILY